MHPESSNSSTLAGLMDHIVAKHHSFCRQELVRIRALFKETVSKHARQHPELKRMESLFQSMAKDLDMHLVKEEQTLFPYIARVEETVSRQGAVSWPPFGSVENPIRVMVQEHDQTGRELSEIRRLSHDYSTPPGEAPEDYRDLYSSLQAFERDMIDHVRAEDQLLFPRAVAMEEDACSRRRAE